MFLETIQATRKASRARERQNLLAGIDSRSFFHFSSARVEPERNLDPLVRTDSGNRNLRLMVLWITPNPSIGVILDQTSALTDVSGSRPNAGTRVVRARRLPLCGSSPFRVSSDKAHSHFFLVLQVPDTTPGKSDPFFHRPRNREAGPSACI